MSFLQDITLEHLYIASASIGGALFVVRILLMLLGGDQGDADGAHDAGDLDHGDAADSDISFKVLSLQGITAFFMMFGLVGWAIITQSPSWYLWSLLGGTLAGLGTIWVLAKIFTFMKGLQSTEELNLDEVVGEEGVVYLTIPPEGTGKVRVTVRGSLKVFDAVSEDKKEIKTNERILVVRIVSGNVLAVSPA